MNPLFILFAAVGGVFNTVQSGANSQLRKSLDQPLLAGMTVYGTGLLGLALVALFWHAGKPTSEKFASVPWWAWLGGVLSLFSTMAGVLLAKQLGSAVFTSLTLTCGLVTSVLLDHLGWVGFEQHKANPLRLVGCGLLVAGIVLISKF